MERWPSGRRRTPGERVTAKPYVGSNLTLSAIKKSAHKSRFFVFIYFPAATIPLSTAFIFKSISLAFVPVSLCSKACCTASIETMLLT